MNVDNLISIFKNTPESSLDIVMTALKEFINIKDSDGHTPLIWACRLKYELIALKLIEKNVDVNVVTIDQYTPLLRACYNKMESVSLALIKKGADINAVDNDKNTPLIWAVWNKMESVSLALIEKGADINAKDNGRNTPFILACSCSLETIAYKLLEKNANVNIQNKSHKTGIDYIRENWEEDAKKKILDLIESKNKPIVAPVVQPEMPVVTPVIQSDTPVIQSDTPATNTPEASAKPKQYPCDMSLTDYFNQNNVPYKVENKIITLL